MWRQALGCPEHTSSYVGFGVYPVLGARGGDRAGDLEDDILKRSIGKINSCTATNYVYTRYTSYTILLIHSVWPDPYLTFIGGEKFP